MTISLFIIVLLNLICCIIFLFVLLSRESSEKERIRFVIAQEVLREVILSYSSLYLVSELESLRKKYNIRLSDKVTSSSLTNTAYAADYNNLISNAAKEITEKHLSPLTRKTFLKYYNVDGFIFYLISELRKINTLY